MVESKVVRQYVKSSVMIPRPIGTLVAHCSKNCVPGVSK